MSDRLAELQRENRLEEAATLAEELGEYARAAGLWERACRFDQAAAAALTSGDAAQALLLAARGNSPQTERQAIEALAADAERSAATCERLARAGHPLTAARLRLAAGDASGAAADFEAGGAWLEAAKAHQNAGNPHSAARCLETLLARDDKHQLARLRLGELLLGHDRTEAAVRALQQIPKAAPERPEALRLLREGLQRLGLSEAVREVERELGALGLDPKAEPRATAADREGALQPSRRPAHALALLFGRYQITRDVATTATARVFEAVDTLTKEQVAVKLFAAHALRGAGRDALRRFEREATALGKLNHPAIVPLRAYLPEGPAVVLQWMDGGSMADLLARGPLAPAHAVEIVTAVLSALGEAHRRAVLHRDIKPANVLLDRSGAAHLADFGMCHVSDHATTVTAGVIGTLAYLAPELRAGQPATIASDVYGAGALLWCALTGGPPVARYPFLSSELGPEHETIAQRLIAAQSERPADTVEARKLLTSVTWPRAVPPARAREPSSPPPPAPDTLRLEPLGEGRYRDRLLERDVYVLEADSATLERVLPLARADHPALPAVLQHRTDPSRVWVEAVSGEPCPCPLDDAAAHRLTEALQALHRAGGVHGSVDPDHVVVRRGSVMLRFALEPRTDSPEDDIRGLSRLRGQ